jgi:glucosamine 6-phosphate synthetase-like amidotransferase/phosphosugar isomerase protein
LPASSVWSTEYVTAATLSQREGYDSAGVAILNNGRLKIVKRLGKVKELASAVEKEEGTSGIAHTRWATHGVPALAAAASAR